MKQSEFSAGRIRSLSDGVFAIAMTLLVLDLKLPPLGPSADQSAVTAALVTDSALHLLDPQFRDPLPALDRSPRALESGKHEISGVHGLEFGVPRRYRHYSLS